MALGNREDEYDYLFKGTWVYVFVIGGYVFHCVWPSDRHAACGWVSVRVSTRHCEYIPLCLT